MRDSAASSNQSIRSATPARTILSPHRSYGLIVELGGVGLAVVGHDVDALVVAGRVGSGGVELDQPKGGLSAGDDGQLDAQVTLVGSVGGRREEKRPERQARRA
jgi:hypothetical protein